MARSSRKYSRFLKGAVGYEGDFLKEIVVDGNSDFAVWLALLYLAPAIIWKLHFYAECIEIFCH